MKSLVLTAVALMLAPCASAFTVDINNGPNRAVYLRVGDGAMVGNYINNQNTAAVNESSVVNVVSVAVPVDDIGDGVIDMDGNSSPISEWDGYAFCNSGEVYIGGFYRSSMGWPWDRAPANASITAQPVSQLTNESGDVIPWNKISWTVSGNGDAPNSQRYAAGTFTGAVQSLNLTANNRQLDRSTWNESCMRFQYANDTVVAGGTYRGTIMYTMSAP